MILHPRQEWQTATQPVTGPKMVTSGIIDDVVHYPGSKPTANYSNPPATLRAMQNDYLTNRKPPYSLGYNYAIDPKGEVWEIRGMDIQSAATGGYNLQSVSCIFLVPGAQPANAAQMNSFVELHVNIFEKGIGRKLGIFGHGQRGTTITPCPGAGIYGQLTTLRQAVENFRLPIPPSDNEWTDNMQWFLFRGPSGQMYATNRKDRAFRCSEDMGANLRDNPNYKYSCRPDNHPWPIEAWEEDIMIGLCGN